MQLLKIFSYVKALVKKPLLWLFLLSLCAALFLLLYAMIERRNHIIDGLKKQISALTLSLEAKNNELDRISRQAAANETICDEQTEAREIVKTIIRCPETTETPIKEVINAETSSELIRFINDHLRLHEI